MNEALSQFPAALDSYRKIHIIMPPQANIATTPNNSIQSEISSESQNIHRLNSLLRVNGWTAPDPVVTDPQGVGIGVTIWSGGAPDPVNLAKHHEVLSEPAATLFKALDASSPLIVPITYHPLDQFKGKRIRIDVGPKF